MQELDIKKSYSLLNEYQYVGKPLPMKFLDWASRPCRTLFGGRTVNLQQGTVSDELSTCGKVARVAIGILLFPLSLLCLTALLIKTITFTCYGEEALLKRIAEEISGKTRELEGRIANGGWEGAEEQFEHQGTDPRLSKDQILLAIESNAPWSLVAKMMANNNDADKVELINQAVARQIAQEFGSQHHSLTFEKIKKLVDESLGNHRELKENCYRGLLDKALRFPNQPTYLEAAIILDLANQTMEEIANFRATDILVNVEKDFLASAYGRGLSTSSKVLLHYKDYMEAMRGALAAIRALHSLPQDAAAETLKTLPLPLHSHRQKRNLICAMPKKKKFDDRDDVTTLVTSKHKLVNALHEEISRLLDKFKLPDAGAPAVCY